MPSLVFWLVMLVLLGGCATVGRHEAGIDNFDQVSPTLYRGAQPSEQGIQTLAQLQIKTVVNLRDDADPREAQWCKAAGITYFQMPLDAQTVTPADAEKVLAVLQAAPAPIFVHCLLGRDRTGLAAAAYRVEVQGWSQQAAIADLRAHGHFWVLFPKVVQAVVALAEKRLAPDRVRTTPKSSAVRPAATPAAVSVHTSTAIVVPN